MRNLHDLLVQGYRPERRNGTVRWKKPDRTTYEVKSAGGSLVCTCYAGERGRLCCHVKAAQDVFATCGTNIIFCQHYGYPMYPVVQVGIPSYACMNDSCRNTGMRAAVEEREHA